MSTSPRAVGLHLFPLALPVSAVNWTKDQLTVSGDKMTKAAVWIRVSTAHQATENQVPDLEKFAAHHGYEIVERYELSESAWNGGKDGGLYRATLQRALEDAWQGKFSVLIVWALDRITREGAEGALRILRQFRERGCSVVSLKEGRLNGSPEIQDVLVAFAGWVAQQESQRRSERIKAGLARRKAEGLPVGGAVSHRGKDRKPRQTTGYVQAWARRKAKAAP
jgi:DNA invertase Pin-like site-specific DNA recombinase